MKTISIILLPLLFLSCFSKNRETRKIDRMNRRITQLEQRVDSLANGKNTYPPPPGTTSDRCQAITIKGKQCKRKAKLNGCCWQHAG